MMGKSSHMYQMWATRPLNEANFAHLRNENNVDHTHPKSGYFVGPLRSLPHVEAEAVCLNTGGAQTRTTQLRAFVFSETQLPVYRVLGNSLGHGKRELGTYIPTPLATD